MTNAQRETATIYQFPVGGRAGLTRATALKSPADHTAPVAEIVCGDSWYHEDAVRDAAEQPRKN